jgi:hypothetical protein
VLQSSAPISKLSATLFSLSWDDRRTLDSIQDAYHNSLFVIFVALALFPSLDGNGDAAAVFRHMGAFDGAAGAAGGVNPRHAPSPSPHARGQFSLEHVTQRTMDKTHASSNLDVSPYLPHFSAGPPEHLFRFVSTGK